MNTGNGMLVDLREVAKLPPEERNKYAEVKRDLTLKERNEKQIRMYSPCGCGSGKKFKFCCYRP